MRTNNQKIENIRDNHFVNNVQLIYSNQKLIIFGIFLVVFIGIISHFTIRVLSEPKKHNCLPLSFYPKNGVYDNDTICKWRRFKEYKLTGNSKNNKTIMNQIILDLNEIKNRKDTLNGVDIVLKEDTRYQDFISCIDLCCLKEPKSFAVSGNHFLYFMYMFNI